MNPDFPVYIVSKGRWGSRLTSKALEKMGVPYKIVVEPQEYGGYSSVISKERILVLPFSNLGQGSIPARNWIWEHSIVEGHKRHWILDDNIRYFRRFNNNKKNIVSSGTIFKAAEDFTERYENVGLSGFQYSSFMAYNRQKQPFVLNTRIYSCILIKNDLPYRWRGKYNEDSDLSINVLKGGYCTILFNAFLQDKQSTMTMKGGNTDNVYTDGDERFRFAESLAKQHPDVAKIHRRYGRWHHSVNYQPFKKNKLIKKPGVYIKSGINNYGMMLVPMK